MTGICREITPEETLDCLRERDDYLIITHSSPDGDTLGSAFGLAGILNGMGKRAEVINGESVPARFSYLGALSDTDSAEGKTVIAVDVADVKLVSGTAAELIKSAELCIDHHPTNKKYAPRLLLDGKAAACCEMIAKLGYAADLVTEKVATALYTGIATDTGCFVFSNVTAETHKIAAMLIESGADAEFVNRLIFDTRSKARMFLESVALKNLKYAFDGKCAYTVMDYDVLHSPESDMSELDAIASIPRTVEGVTVGFTLKGREKGKFKVSVRSYPPVNASKVCAAFGGGGHESAAGCEIEGSADEVIDRVLREIKEQLI